LLRRLVTRFPASAEIRHLTDVSGCKLQDHFLCNPHQAFPSRPLGNPMNVMATASPDEHLMTRHEVASLFRVTSALVAQWARRGRLSEVRDQAGRPRYRRADVEEILRRGFRPRTR
jgi:MerR HTH family regulatory protein